MNDIYLKTHLQQIKKTHKKNKTRYKITVNNLKSLSYLQQYLSVNQMSFSHFVNVYLSYFLDNQKYKKKFNSDEFEFILQTTPKKNYRKSIQLIHEHIYTVSKELQNKLNRYLNTHRNKTVSELVNEGLNQFFVVDDDKFQLVNNFFKKRPYNLDMDIDSDEHNKNKTGETSFVVKKVIEIESRPLKKEEIINRCKKRIIRDLYNVAVAIHHLSKQTKFFYLIFLDTVNIEVTTRRKKKRKKDDETKEVTVSIFRYHIYFFYTVHLVGTFTLNEQRKRISDLHILHDSPNKDYSYYNFDFSSIQFEKNILTKDDETFLCDKIDSILNGDESYSNTSFWGGLNKLIADYKKTPNKPFIDFYNHILHYLKPKRENRKNRPFLKRTILREQKNQDMQEKDDKAKDDKENKLREELISMLEQSLKQCVKEAFRRKKENVNGIRYRLYSPLIFHKNRQVACYSILIKNKPITPKSYNGKKGWFLYQFKTNNKLNIKELTSISTDTESKPVVTNPNKDNLYICGFFSHHIQVDITWKKTNI